MVLIGFLFFTFCRIWLFKFDKFAEFIIDIFTRRFFVSEAASFQKITKFLTNLTEIYQGLTNLKYVV